jgi:hypothetical protein
MALYTKNILQSIKNLSNDTKQFKSALKSASTQTVPQGIILVE